MSALCISDLFSFSKRIHELPSQGKIVYVEIKDGLKMIPIIYRVAFPFLLSIIALIEAVVQYRLWKKEKQRAKNNL